MPDPPSAGPGGGIFKASKEITEKTSDNGQELLGVQLTPAITPILLQLLNRVASLEATARASRLAELESKERVQVLVLGDQEAQTEIERLSLENASLTSKLEKLEGGEIVDEGTIAELRTEVNTLKIQLEQTTAQIASMATTIGAVGAQLIQLGNFKVETSEDIRVVQDGVLAQAAALAAV